MLKFGFKNIWVFLHDYFSAIISIEDDLTTITVLWEVIHVDYKEKWSQYAPLWYTLRSNWSGVTQLRLYLNYLMAVCKVALDELDGLV